jgi:hypothetical protein
MHRFPTESVIAVTTESRLSPLSEAMEWSVKVPATVALCAVELRSGFDLDELRFRRIRNRHHGALYLFWNKPDSGVRDDTDDKAAFLVGIGLARNLTFMIQGLPAL